MGRRSCKGSQQTIRQRDKKNSAIYLVSEAYDCAVSQGSRTQRVGTYHTCAHAQAAEQCRVRNRTFEGRPPGAAVARGPDTDKSLNANRRGVPYSLDVSTQRDRERYCYRRMRRNGCLWLARKMKWPRGSMYMAK
jgi:hypothetical protein